MKKILPAMLCLLLSVSLSIPVAAASQAETLAQQLETMRPALVALFAIAAVLAFLCVLFTVIYVVNSGKKTAMGGSMTETTQARTRYAPSSRIPRSQPGAPSAVDRPSSTS